MSRALEILERMDEVRIVKRRAVRGGKVVRLKKRLYANICGKGMKHDSSGKCVPMTSKEKMAIKRLHSATAKRSRARSMALRRRMIHQGMDESSMTLAAIHFDEKLYGDDYSGIIDELHDVLKEANIDYQVDDPDTLPIEIEVEDFDAVASILSQFEGVTLIHLGDEEDEEFDESAEDESYDEEYDESAEDESEFEEDPEDGDEAEDETA